LGSSNGNGVVAAEIFLDRCLKPWGRYIDLDRAARQTPPQTEDSDDRQRDANRYAEKQAPHKRPAKQIGNSVAQTKPRPSPQAMHHAVTIRHAAHGHSMVGSMPALMSVA
jgi:hypothetical protein